MVVSEALFCCIEKYIVSYDTIVKAANSTSNPAVVAAVAGEPCCDVVRVGVCSSCSCPAVDGAHSWCQALSHRGPVPAGCFTFEVSCIMLRGVQWSTVLGSTGTGTALG
jgi:hypothetical protein